MQPCVLKMLFKKGKEIHSEKNIRNDQQNREKL